MSTLHESAIHKLHPTQLTVGMIEVHLKKKHLRSLNSSDQKDFMRAHPIPAVLGPNGRLFITDHHHLGRAAFEVDVFSGFFEIEADFSNFDASTFWIEMEKEKWVHPLDENGIRRDFSLIPKHLEKLLDDPYRSLAGFVRNAGGYVKTPTAFAEFVWADFFRKTIPIEAIRSDFDATVLKAKHLAQSKAAAGMPGFAAVGGK